MIVLSACQASSPRFLANENLSRPNCPRCGSVVHTSEASRPSFPSVAVVGQELPIGLNKTVLQLLLRSIMTSDRLS